LTYPAKALSREKTLVCSKYSSSRQTQPKDANGGQPVQMPGFRSNLPVEIMETAVDGAKKRRNAVFATPKILF